MNKEQCAMTISIQSDYSCTDCIHFNICTLKNTIDKAIEHINLSNNLNKAALAGDMFRLLGIYCSDYRQRECKPNSEVVSG